MLETSLFLRDGTALPLALKAWPKSGPQGQFLLWEMRRLLPLAGYETKSHRTKVCNIIRGQFEKWEALMTWLGWSVADLFEQNPESGVATKGMLALVAYWSETRRDSSLRHRCSTLGTTILQAAIHQGEFFQMLKPLLQPTLPEKELCTTLPNSNGECACWQSQKAWLQDEWERLGHAPRHPHAEAWKIVSGLFGEANCGTTGQVAGRLLTQLADLIHENFDRASVVNWLLTHFQGWNASPVCKTQVLQMN